MCLYPLGTITMAQDPDQIQPGEEARANDISMDGKPSEQEIAIG